MSKLLTLAATTVGVALVPVVAVLALLGVAGNAIACTPVVSALATTAPVPAQGRIWVALTHVACPDLPQPWIAALIHEESGFRPDAASPGPRGDRRGLFGLTQQAWRTAYGAGWDADENHNGIADITEPDIHATIAGKYLCALLTQVRTVRAAHQDWAATTDLTELDDLLLASTAGFSQLRSYPQIPNINVVFATTVHTETEAWGSTTIATPPNLTPPLPGSAEGGVNSACVSDLAAVGTVLVPPGTPTTVAHAVDTALKLVGTPSGFSGLCDHLACLAYGFEHSGYPSAIAHWHAMLATGHADPGNRCPPLGSFLFWNAGTYGHVSLVVHSDPACDPAHIQVVSNDVLNQDTGHVGGVYLVSLARIESGFVTRAQYLGWSDPVCAGA